MGALYTVGKAKNSLGNRKVVILPNLLQRPNQSTGSSLRVHGRGHLIPHPAQHSRPRGLTSRPDIPLENLAEADVCQIPNMNNPLPISQKKYSRSSALR